MINLAGRIRKIISGDTNILIQGKNHPFDCVKARRGILRELMISKESGNLIGLITPALGEGMFLILVLSIEPENSEGVVVFQRYDISDSRILPTAKLNINEIKGVCPFNTNKQFPLKSAHHL